MRISLAQEFDFKRPYLKNNAKFWQIDGSEIFRSAFFAIFGSYRSVFGHFFGVRGAAQCGSSAQNMPLGPLETGEQKNTVT